MLHLGGEGVEPVKHNGYGNYIPNGGGSQEGSRIALLPQKARKFYSFKAVKEALSDKLWKQAYVPVNVFLLFARKDDEHYPVGACLGADPRTIARILDFARERDLAVLHLGLFFLRKETAEKLRENRKIAKGDREKLAQLDLHAISGANKLVRLAHRVLIDIDHKDTKALWRLIKYLRKLGIYPEVWETQKGYHVYIYFYHRKRYRVVSVEDEDGKRRVKKVFQGYELPFAKDYRIKHVEKGLKELCSKVGIQADIVSASHAVWVEGVPNPLKGGFATKRILTGRPLPLEDLWHKTLPLWLPKELFRKPRYRVRKPKNEENAEDALRELDNLLEPPYSNVFFALSRHGTLKACRQLWKAGYSLLDIEDELRSRLDIRTKTDEEALQKFLKYFDERYTDTQKPQASPPREKERKHEHYWELAPKVREALEKGYLKTTHIARYLGCTRDRVKKFKSFLKNHGYSLEDLLTRYEEVMAFLKVHAKGGNKAQRKKEWDREAWLEEFQRRKAEFIQRCKEEAEIRRAKKREELEAKGIDPDGWYSWWQIPVGFYPAESGTIDDIQFVGGGKGVSVRAGIFLTNRPRPRTCAESPQLQQHASKTPAVPLVVLSASFESPLSLNPISEEASQESTHPLRKALFDLLKKYHSEDGLPVVLVVPRKVSHGKNTLLQLTPYKVPPRSEILKQLWEEIKEKFGKTVQGLSTKNGALEWFHGVWEKFKEEIMARGWVSVGSSPFTLSKKLSTSQEEPSNKLTEAERSEKAHPEKSEPMHQMLYKTFGEEVKPMQEQITAFTSSASSNGCVDPKTALPVPVDGESLSSSTSASKQETLTSTPSSSGQDNLPSSTHTQEEFEKETEEPVELVASEEGLREEEQKRMPSEMTWEDLLQALVDGELSEEEFERILFETEKKKGITLRGVFSVIRKLLENAEKAQNCLKEGKIQEAEKLLERINKYLKDLEEKTRDALEKRGGLKHSRKKLIAILMKLNDFSLKQIGVHLIYKREEIGKFIKLLDGALERYLTESGYDLEKDFQRIVRAFLETYAYAFLRWKPTREMFFKKFIDYRWEMKFTGEPIYFKDATGRTYSTAEIISWVDNYLEQTTSVPSFPSSQVVQTVVRFLEERTQGSDLVKVSGEELATAIYTAWKNADQEKANRKAVSEYIDKFEGVLWKKLNNGHYVLLVGSDKVKARIRDYVLELKQAKKNGQGQTSADGNGSMSSKTKGKGQPHTNVKGSVGSTVQPQLFNGKDDKSQPPANGNGSLGSTSLPTNGNGKYDIDHIIHTLEEKGSVVVPPQWVHEIVRELRRRGFSVNYWPATGLIELVGGDDELPF
jgi:hypothetical protein